MNKQLLSLHHMMSKFGMHISEAPSNDVPPELFYDRLNMLEEELMELRTALAMEHKADTLDALIDLQVALSSLVVMLGYHKVFDEAFTRVHLANLQKERGTNAKREHLIVDLVKPDGWQAPNLEDLIGE
jgi:predicted HAD superfamily Cof-like phosphohydrolase